MLSAEPQIERTEDSVSRRAFLRAGGLSVVGLSLTDQAAWAELFHGGQQKNCILVLMTGGASQLETFDPKPDAGADIRGNLKAIETSVPGTFLSETLPQLAQRSHQFSLIRSIHHSAAPIHETGLQLLQTGRLSWKGVRFPTVERMLQQASGRSYQPLAAILPKPLQNTGRTNYLGQDDADFSLSLEQLANAAFAREPDAVRRTYGSHRFGELLLKSRLLVELGVRSVTVNLFDELGPKVTWDAHGDADCGPATIADYRDRLCPAFDAAMSRLLDDLSQRGLLEDTLVIAVGEMGRSPRINPNGGRDHWTNCWSALVAGGGTMGGQVIGASDDTASYPVDRPVSLGELPASILHWFGIEGNRLTAVVGKQELPLIPHEPIQELWGPASATLSHQAAVAV